MQRCRRFTQNLLFLAMLLVSVTAQAAGTPEQTCQKGRYNAAAKYVACQQKVMAKFGPSSNFEAAVSKCRVKYTDTWRKLQARAQAAPTVETCDAARFVDNGGGTVTDNLTGLQWEQKTDDVSVHDKDNTYSWSAGGGGFTAADGTAYTTFLAALNSGGCFAGQCDWRLPTFYELQTILLEPFPCTTSPCIDPIFGPTYPFVYYTATTFTWILPPTAARTVHFDSGSASNGSDKSDSRSVRAVRGGL